MTKDQGSRKSTKKRNAEAAGLDNSSTHSKNDFSDHDDGDDSSDISTGRNFDHKTTATENDNISNGGRMNNDNMSDDALEVSSKKAKGDNVSGSISSDEGDKKPAAENVGNDEASDSHGEERTELGEALDPGSPLPQKRRKKPSEKLRLQHQHEDLVEPATESRERRSSSRRQSSTNTPRSQSKKLPPENNSGARYKKSRLKKLDPEEEKLVLQRAQQKGLPDGWKVAYHKDWKRKVWISPDQSRICDTVPRAIAISQKMAADAEMGYDDDAAKDNGEGDGDDHGMEEDDDDIDGKANDDDDEAQDDTNEKGDDEQEDEGGVKVANSFVTLKKGGVVGTDPASVLIATSEDLHEMSEKQEEASLKKGRAKGLRDDGWRCVWNSRFRRKNWVSPHGRLFGNLSRAVEKQDDWIIKQEKKKMKENKKLQELEEEWQKQFKRLKKYKRRHGDTLVPDHYERYAELPFWVRKQRREYARLQAGTKSIMTPEKIEELNTIGFQWVVAKRSAKSKQAAAAGAADTSPTAQTTPQEPDFPPPPEGSVFDNAPEEMFTRRHVLFADMQPPPVAPARVPIKFVNPIRKLPNGSLGTESYCREVEQYLKTWYGAGEGN